MCSRSLSLSYNFVSFIWVCGFEHHLGTYYPDHDCNDLRPNYVASVHAVRHAARDSCYGKGRGSEGPDKIRKDSNRELSLALTARIVPERPSGTAQIDPPPDPPPPEPDKKRSQKRRPRKRTCHTRRARGRCGVRGKDLFDVRVGSRSCRCYVPVREFNGARLHCVGMQKIFLRSCHASTR